MRGSWPSGSGWACRPAACSSRPARRRLLAVLVGVGACGAAQGAQVLQGALGVASRVVAAGALAAALGVRDQAAGQGDGGQHELAERAPRRLLGPDRLKPGAEAPERVAGGRAQAVDRGRVGAGGDQIAAVAIAGVGDHALDAGRADPAPRRGDRACERLGVARVGHERQVGERVADLGALVEPERAEHPVRDPGRGEPGHERGVGVRGAGQHQHLGARQPAGQRARQPAADPVRLRVLVGHGDRAHPSAGPAHGVQRLLAAARVVRDAGAGGGEDLRARAEVAGEHDPPVARVAPTEVEDRGRVGAAEAVDQLVLVADGGQVAVGAGQQVDQSRLGGVDVLELVDEQPAPAPAQVREPVRVAGQQGDRVREQVVEAERVAARELGLGGAPDRGGQRPGGPGERALQRGRVEQPRLRVADRALELAGAGPAVAARSPPGSRPGRGRRAAARSRRARRPGRRS